MVSQEQESDMPTLSHATTSQASGLRAERPIEVIGKKSAAHDSAFETMVDALNPLQILPGIGQAYRKVSGDKSSTGAQLAGKVALGAALGGPIGAAVGAGVFVLEKALPGVFNMIGHLFSSGKNSDSKADMPGLVGEKQSAAAPAHRPLIEGLDARPGSKQRSVPQPKLGGAAPSMSASQFDALMQSIGAQPIETAEPATKRSAAAKSDVAALIQANLDKYHRQQQLSGAAAYR
jgi:hypothetical protein